MQKTYLLLFFLLPVAAHTQTFYYNLNSLQIVGDVVLVDSTNQSTDPANGPVATTLDWSGSNGAFSHLQTYCAPDASSGIEVRTHGTNAKVNAGTGNRFNNDSTYFEGTNGQSIPVHLYLSLDGNLHFQTLSSGANYCGHAADGSICQFVSIDNVERFSTCARTELHNNRLTCLNCIFHEPEYTVNLLPKLLLSDNTAVSLSAEAVDSLLVLYNSLSPAQITDNNLGMSVNFVNFINTSAAPKSVFFTQPWITFSSINTASYESFERLVLYSGYYADWGLTQPQASSAKLAIDYHLQYDIQDSIDLTATAAPFKFSYLFYSDLTSDGPCETDLTSNFLNTFKIDSVRVADGFFSLEVNFDSLFLVIAPGTRIPVKSAFQNTSATASPGAVTSVQVSPNPATDVAYVQTRGAAIERLTLLDQWGRVQYTAAGQAAGQYQIDLRGLPAGVYFLALENGGQREVKKLVKR